MLDQRMKNAGWAVFRKDGSKYLNYDHAILAVLMDLRDELQDLGYDLDRIRRQMPAKRKRRAKR